MIPLENKLDLTELLEYIDPSQLNYQEWIKVGMDKSRYGFKTGELGRFCLEGIEA